MQRVIPVRVVPTIVSDTENCRGGDNGDRSGIMISAGIVSPEEHKMSISSVSNVLSDTQFNMSHASLSPDGSGVALDPHLHVSDTSLSSIGGGVSFDPYFHVSDTRLSSVSGGSAYPRFNVSPVVDSGISFSG